MPRPTKIDGAKICRDAFGAVLTAQGRGYYVTLELLAIVWGTICYKGSAFSSQTSEPIGYTRRSHDFARRCMAGDPLRDNEKGFIRGDETRGILQALLESLRVPIPGRRVMPGWLGQHLYPYLGELIHYDAAPRGQSVSIERYTYRGGGGLAHRIIRTDPNNARLEANRRNFADLVKDGGGALGDLARACSAHDIGRDKQNPFPDEMEHEAKVYETVWVEHLRQGIFNIASRNIVRAKKIELLMVWVPYCIARHQLNRATEILQLPPMFFPAALTVKNGPVRQLARSHLNQARKYVEEALRVTALNSSTDGETHSEADVQRGANSRAWRAPFLSFFTQTLATVGALNAQVGTRYLTMQLPLIEALVCASLEPNQEIKFEDFCQRTLSSYQIVAAAGGHSGAGLLARVNAADLAENQEQLAQDLEALGLLTSYSDATRMVHGEVK